MNKPVSKDQFDIADIDAALAAEQADEDGDQEEAQEGLR